MHTVNLPQGVPLMCSFREVPLGKLGRTILRFLPTSEGRPHIRSNFKEKAADMTVSRFASNLLG